MSWADCEAGAASQRLWLDEQGCYRRCPCGPQRSFVGVCTREDVWFGYQDRIWIDFHLGVLSSDEPIYVCCEPWCFNFLWQLLCLHKTKSFSSSSASWYQYRISSSSETILGLRMHKPTTESDTVCLLLNFSGKGRRRLSTQNFSSFDMKCGPTLTYINSGSIWYVNTSLSSDDLNSWIFVLCLHTTVQFFDGGAKWRPLLAEFKAIFKRFSKVVWLVWAVMLRTIERLLRQLDTVQSKDESIQESLMGEYRWFGQLRSQQGHASCFFFDCFVDRCLRTVWKP